MGGQSSFGIHGIPPYRDPNVWVALHKHPSSQRLHRHSPYGQLHCAHNLRSLHRRDRRPYVLHLYSNVLSKHSFSKVFIITKIFIDRLSIYGCRSLVRNRPHLDLIVIMGIIVPVITIRTYLHVFHHLPHLVHLLLHLLLHHLLDLLELLEFGSRRSLPVMSIVIKGIVTVALTYNSPKLKESIGDPFREDVWLGSIHV
jgi:hypothetical protein